MRGNLSSHNLRCAILFGKWFEGTNGRALSPKLITPQDVRDYRQHLLQRKASAATINRKLLALKVHVKWARSAKLIEFDPTENVKLVEEQPVAPRWLDRLQQNALVRQAQRELNAAKTDIKKAQALRDISLVQMLLHTALRVSELCALTTGDLTTSDRKGKARVRQGKGTKQRLVPLNSIAMTALKAWLDVRPQAGHGFVFTGKGGLPLNARGVQTVLAELGRVAGLEVTPHVLRHTFAKNLVDRGVPLDQIAALMGHSSLNTTRIYTTPSEADLERAVGVMGDG